jgi:hypothetical protein
MSKVFKVAAGRYDIPKIGRLDTTVEVSDERLFAIYKLPRKVFPWISLKSGAKAFLKKQKLTVKEIASLVQNASSAQELELLSGISDSKTITGIAETKLKALENNKN